MTISPSLEAAPLLEMRGIEKSFPGVRALDGVDLKLHGGEVLALLGENGAGKSTLIKMLGGAHLPDRGDISMNGNRVDLSSPQLANQHGIAVIYQELNLIPGLTAWENIFLGRERHLGLVSRSDERRRSQEILAQIGAKIPIDVPCETLSISQQQIVEIAKALAQDVRLIVMDEPSAALTPNEVERLFQVIDDLRCRKIGVIYISHRLDEIFQIADRVVVLRDGSLVGQSSVSDIDRAGLIHQMVGREIENEFPRVTRAPGNVRLSVRGLARSPAVEHVSFDLCAGEIVGLSGLIGSGRTEVARLIFGADKAHFGTICLDGKSLTIHNPKDAIEAGICLLTEDRKHQGLIASANVIDNFTLANLDEFTRFGFVKQRSATRAFERYVDQLRIRISSYQQLAEQLSGGNQQKVVMAKWLQRNAEVIIFDEPTRGIDVGAKYEIYQLMNELAGRGKAILMISSELPEVLGMSDRVLVMHQGRITGEIQDVAHATQQQIMELAVA